MYSKTIYMDNAASTRTDPAVVDAMLPFFTEHYAVASSQFSHSPGIYSREALDKARTGIAGYVNAEPDEIIFTSGSTEANNLALKGLALANDKKHIICSSIEHNSVMHTCRWLEKQGFELTLIPVDSEGFIDIGFLEKELRKDTLLVSVQHGNQEVGSVQDIVRISELCREHGVIFHSDASLTLTHMPIDLRNTPVDLMSFSGHRIHGPKGIGALFIRKGTPLQKIMHGGYSEFDMRPGTENIPGAVGFAKAVEIASDSQNRMVRALQKQLVAGLVSGIDGVALNGPENFEKRLPGNVNVSFDRIEGESVVLHFDMQGISVITGSACFSRSLEPSHVMMAMGFSHERAHGSIRFTMSKFNTSDEIDQIIAVSREVVENLRKISPIT